MRRVFDARLLARVATALFLAAVFWPLAASAQHGTVRSVHNDWQIRCETAPGAPAEQCALVQSVTAEDRPNVGLTVIILKTADRCTITEEERLQAQQLFPKAKVFSMRFSCDDDVEENLTYTNVNDKFGFLAVYAGLTMKEAKARLAEAKATGKFPGANIRKMQAKRISP